MVEADGRVEPLVVDPWADLLNRPTNLAFGDGVLYYANLGGYHIGVLPVSDVGAPLHQPTFSGQRPPRDLESGDRSL